MPVEAIENHHTTSEESRSRLDSVDSVDACSADSADEALSEMLGIATNTISMITMEEDDEQDTVQNTNANTNANTTNPLDVLQYSTQQIQQIAHKNTSHQIYKTESICILPKELSIPSSYMRRLTDELVYGDTKHPSDKSYEKIQYISKGINKSKKEIQERRELTRFENFVNSHPGWHDLCHSYLTKCISEITGEEMVLFKEKLNLKPPGGSGFAPHLDAPSLCISLGEKGPQTFVTVMVAIDDMNETNGCLRVCKGEWDDENHIETIKPEQNGNPDAGGRAGAIDLDVADPDGKFKFVPIECKGGDIVAFNGFAPHRSSANVSPFSRRAVFLTFNPKREGDFHDEYYENMKNIRDDWVQKMKSMRDADYENEMEALRSIPRA